MKPIKALLIIILTGFVAFVASNASAVQGTVTISGTASYQDYNSSDCAIVKTHKIDQKLILQLLAEATGDASITNKPTQLIYDPDAFNYNWYYSYDGSGSYKYGVFYYSNSVSGLKKLDSLSYGSYGNYRSYIELDSYTGHGWGFDSPLGFAYPYYSEYNQVAKEGDTSVNLTGHATLYVHSDPYYFNLPSHHYYANNCYGYYQSRAIVIRGLINLKGEDKGATVSQSFTLNGTGDGVWYDSEEGYIPLVISKGTVKFSGSGPD